MKDLKHSPAKFVIRTVNIPLGIALKKYVNEEHWTQWWMPLRAFLTSRRVRLESEVHTPRPTDSDSDL